MNWETAMGLLAFIVSHLGVEIFRSVRERGREAKEQDALDATAGLTVAEANVKAEEAEDKKFDRTAKMYKMIDELRERMRAQDERMEELSDELDAERNARQENERKLRAKLIDTINKLRVSVTFAEYLISLIPPPTPEFPEGWAKIHDFEDLD